MKEKPIYKVYKEFVFRTPLFSLNEVNTKEKLDSDMFKEAIFLASPELYNGNRSGEDKKQQKFEASLLKYLHRATTRCTPFGLFAGCSVGSIGAETDIRLLPPERNQRTTRLDMQYLCALIQHIEQIPEVRSQLRFYPNDSLYPIGGKCRYIEYHYKKSNRIHNVISLNIDEPLTMLLETASLGATIDQLTALFVDDEISYEEAAAYVNEAISSQVLKSELDPCVVGEDVFNALISRLSELKNVEVIAPLKRIQVLLNEIDSHPIGTTLPLYQEIIKEIETIGVEFEAKFLFQTDLFKPVEKAVISEEIADKISRLIGFLAKITPPREEKDLSDFKAAFESRYETEEIPLAIALDRELGLSYPVSAKGGNDLCPLINEIVFPATGSFSERMKIQPLDRVLLKKYTECMRNNDMVVEICDDDFKDISYSNELPDTMSVMCNVLNDGKLYVHGVGGNTGTSLLGRFCHLAPSIKQLVQDAVDTEQDLQPEKIVAEISHLPESRIGNIASRPACRKYTLHYLSNYERDKEEISISDLMVSVKNGKIMLRSKKYDKEVIPRLSCAHNYMLSFIPVYRFLCDLQNQKVSPYFFCSWNSYFETLDYLPRICYNNIILTRQRWRLKLEEVDGFDKLPDDELVVRMSEVAKQRALPSEVVIPDADNELYIDLRLPESVRLLLSYLNSRKQITLEEFLFSKQGAVAHLGEEAFTNEVIFLFHK